MCQVNHFPLTLSNGGRNLQIRRRNGENTKHDFREVRPAQIRPPHSLRQFHQILTDRLIISKLYFVCKFLWSDTCFGWSTGWQGKSEGKSGGLGLVWFRSLSFHRHCHMLSRYFDGVTLGPSYVKDHYFDDEICHHFRPSDTVTRRPRGQLSGTSVTPASVDDNHLNHTHQHYRLFSNQ